MIIENVKRFLSVDWIKTIFLNIYYLGFIRALKFPILVGYGVKIGGLGDRNSVKIGNSFASLCYGLKGGPYNLCYKESYWGLAKNSEVIIEGTCRISKGTILSVSKNGKVVFGDKFSSNANLFLACMDSISFGDDCLLGWNITIMDNDGGHGVYESQSGHQRNVAKPIVFGNHVWIGTGASVLKGAEVKDGSIIAMNANVCGLKCEYSNSIIAGSPAKEKKADIKWEH